MTRFRLFKLYCVRREASDGAIFIMLMSNVRRFKKLAWKTVLAGK
jgi:hypothetical protein